MHLCHFCFAGQSQSALHFTKHIALLISSSVRQQNLQALIHRKFGVPTLSFGQFIFTMILWFKKEKIFTMILHNNA